MRLNRVFCSLAFGLLLPWTGQSGAFSNAGPLFQEFPLTLAPGHRTEAGPFFYSQQRESEHTWALPPLLSYTHDPDLDLTEFDLAYPVISYDRYGKQFRWQLFQLLSFGGGETQTETNRNRFTIFPIYFQQRSSDTNENYTAFVPFYGHLKHRLMRDDIFFVMFPFYSVTRKGDVVTHNYVYPIYHHREGPGLKGWQVWPFVGHEHKDITTRTNGFGDTEMVPGHDSRFVMWPCYFNDYADLGTTNVTHSQGVIPFYAQIRSPQRDSSTVLWPFFSHITDREKKFEEWQVPFPLIEFAHGSKTTKRVWPFFSRSQNTNLESIWYLWPVYKVNRIHAQPLEWERKRILFFLYSDINESSSETHVSRRRTDLWPFFTRNREFNGNTHLQVLALLEPWMPGAHKIERDYSQVYALWRSEHNAKTQASSQSLLWNLYRRQADPTHKKVTALFGLYQYEAAPEGKRLRLFYIPVLHPKPSPSPAAEPKPAQGSTSPALSN